MAKLFDIERNKIVPHPDILAIPAMKKLWNRDKSDDKEKALNEISYIVFLHAFKSPYRDINSNEKEGLIIKEVFRDENWKPDSLVKEAEAVFINLNKTRHSDMLKGLEHVEEEITYYLKNINLRELDDFGKSMYNMKEIISNAKELGNIIKSISILEKQVNLELEEQNVRGTAAIGYFEDAR